MLTTLGNQLGAAIENAQLYGEMEQRVQELSSRMEHLAIVQERERISREIHDGLAQALALLNMRVNVASSLLVAGQTDQARKELDEAAQVIDAANRDVREAITALRLTAPKGAGFVPTLREFVLDFGLIPAVLRWQTGGPLPSTPPPSRLAPPSNLRKAAPAGT